MLRRLTLLLLLALPVGGCRSFETRVFGVPLQASEPSSLTTEEKAGTLLIVGIAVAAAVAGTVVALD